MDIEQEASAVKSSLQNHQNASYYNSYKPLSEEAKQLIHQDHLVTAGGDPQLVARIQKEKEVVQKGITKYKFMNDGPWMKVLVDRNDYPDIKELPLNQFNVEFKDQSFDLKAQVNDKLIYHLKIERLSHEIVPEKCKLTERKTMIQICLWKLKEDDWWTLKYT